MRHFNRNNLESTEDCPSYPPNNYCLSDGECNVCRRIDGVHDGCNYPGNTTKPVCDMIMDDSNDIGTLGIQATAFRKVAECVSCKKTGRCIVIL